MRAAGLSQQELDKTIAQAIAKRIEHPLFGYFRPWNFDYKTALQELVQRKKDQLLHYELIGESGPDHDKHFTVEVLLNGSPVGQGSGSSKKRAEQAAAEAAIEKLFPNEL